MPEASLSEWVSEGCLFSRFRRHSVFHKLIQRADEAAKSTILTLLHVPAEPETRCVDLGAGDGSFSFEVAGHLGLRQIWLADIGAFTQSWNQIAALSGIAYVGCRADFSQPLCFAQDFFHVVISNQVLEHLYDPFAHLREIHRILRDDGYAIISTPNLAALHYRLMLLVGLMPPVITVGLWQWSDTLCREVPRESPSGRHISTFTIKEWKKLLTAAGFDIVKTRTAALHFVPPAVTRVMTRVLHWGNFAVFKVRKAGRPG